MSIEFDVEDEHSRQLWSELGDLVERLPGEWVLVGGLMVHLYGVQAGMTDIRPTRDIDVLAQARPPTAIQQIARVLEEDGFRLEMPDADGYAYRYVRGDLTVDVPSPDGIKPPPKLTGALNAVSIPGGTQALTRSELVEVKVDGRTIQVRRPTLLGAILIKARSLMSHADPEAQREDLIRLLALIEDPRTMAGELKKSERGWLRDVEARLDLDGFTRLAPVGAA